MYKLFINNVQIGNYKTVKDLNRSAHNVFMYVSVTDMKLVDEGGFIAIMLTQKN